MAVKLSKNTKARIVRMKVAERKSLLTAANLLADCEAISYGRWLAISRQINRVNQGGR